MQIGHMCTGTTHLLKRQEAVAVDLIDDWLSLPKHDWSVERRIDCLNNLYLVELICFFNDNTFYVYYYADSSGEDIIAYKCSGSFIPVSDL